MTERVQYGSLQVAKELDELLAGEILPGLNVTPLINFGFLLMRS